MSDLKDAIQISVSDDDVDAINRLQDIGDGNVVLSKSDHFEGDVGIWTALISISTTTIPVIGLIVRERIKAARYVKIKVKGVEISGANLSEIEKFLRKRIET